MYKNPNYQKEYRKKHKKEEKENKKKWKEKNPEYNKEYHQKHKKELNEKSKKWRKEHPGKITEYRKTPAGSLSQIWRNLRNSKYPGRRNITKEDFLDWYNAQKKECIYCCVKEKDLKRDIFWKNRRSKRLEIERIDSDRKYEKGNLALACKFCNMLKSNIFTYKEMKIIGKFIKNKRKKFIKDWNKNWENKSDNNFWK